MITKEEYTLRRQKLLEKMDVNSFAIIFAGVAKVASEDEELPFEPNHNFYYLTGIEQSNSVLILFKNSIETKEYLFIDEKDIRVEKWLGYKLSFEEAKDISGIENIYLRNTFEGKAEALLSNGITKIYLDFSPELKIGECKSVDIYKKEISSKYPKILIDDIYPFLVDLRLIKSPAEIEMMKEAISITDLGLRQVLKEISSGRSEKHLRDLFNYQIRENGAQGNAFGSIVASGSNGIILHYPFAKDTLKPNELTLFDVGAKYHFYNADISRTYPNDGKFTDLQKKIYSIVLACNKATANFVRPGIDLKDVQKFALDFLAEECYSQGLIASKENIRDVYYHSVSHFLGIDTHDVGGRERILKPGMVITDEPGLYFKEYGIGIRIEDDVLVTETGSEVLSKDVIKEISDIEKMLSYK